MGFSEFFGNSRTVTALRSMLAEGRVPHAMLFTGPRGVGKFTLARMFAQAANCERLKDDFCGDCQNCRRIGLLADLPPLLAAALAERGERADAAAVERVPLLIETHPDVWAIVPDPVRAKEPVVRPVLHMGQLRAVQRAAQFKPLARRRVFILDGAETMRWDYAGIFLKILEEPPESSTLILLAPSPFQVLPTIRSRCFQFAFTALLDAEVEQIVALHSELQPAERKLAAQFANGSAGVALELDLEAALALRREALFVLEQSIDLRGISDLFAQTAALAKDRATGFENVLEVFYSLLTDLLDLSCSPSVKVLRNPSLRKQLETLSKKTDLAWISKAVGGLDVLHARLRRNINRSLGLDALAVSLARSVPRGASASAEAI